MQNLPTIVTEWATEANPIFAKAAQALVEAGDIPAPASKKQAQEIVAAIAGRALLGTREHAPHIWEAFAGNIHEALQTN